MFECQKERAKLSERKTVHQWLNGVEIPSKEFGKPICLLRRLRIAIDKLNIEKRKINETR